MAGKSLKPSHEPPHVREDRNPSHWLNSGKKGREGGGYILEDVLPLKMLTVDAIPVMAANTSQSEGSHVES